MKENDAPTNQAPKICVIGAGPCGLAVAKNLLQQGLTDFIVFEKNGQVGGNWIFCDQNNHSSVYETTHIISSKRLSQYDDFPMPNDYPDYPSHRQLRQYFNTYADHFGLKPYISFNTQVDTVTRTSTNRWEVVYRNEQGMQTAWFDYLFIANGHHWDPLIPSYPGTFDGELMHAHLYKRAAPFKDKRVLVVGGGNSACDIAVEVARVAAKTCISIRNGQHIFPKFIFGKPTDMAFKKISWMPFWCRQQLARMVIRMLQGRYKKYQLTSPQTKALAEHPTINSELLYFIRHGKIFPRQKIERLEQDGVYFSDGQKEAFDTIIFATGYKISFPFFAKELIDYSTQAPIPLYRKMLHPEFNNLFFIGLFQPQGCIWPLADHQAKIAVGIINGTVTFPADLSAKINKEIKIARKCFKESPRHALEVDYHLFRKQLLRHNAK